MKTPTQEDQAGLSCSTSDGSSSGYASQSTVRETADQGMSHTDGPARQSSCPSSSSSVRPTRGSLLRPYSYTGGVVTSPTQPQPQPISERQFSEALGQQLGVTTGRTIPLRRSSSQTSYKA